MSSAEKSIFMITVISGTNRKNSETLLFAKHYTERFRSLSQESIKLLALEDLPQSMLHPDMYAADQQSKELADIQDEFMIPADKFFILVPEYNGSIPGIMKLFLDACSVREYKATFKHKKVGLAGIASGRAGNLRGMDHLASVFHHVGSLVFPNMLPISSISQLVDENKTITHEKTLKTIDNQIETFLAF